MRKNRHRFYESSADVPYDPDRYVITRDDLEGDEIGIYDYYLAKLNHPTSTQLRMLATYAYIAIEFKKAAENKKLAAYLRRCMVYARNGLQIWKPEPIDPLELLLECEQDWPDTFLYLDNAWEVPAN